MSEGPEIILATPDRIGTLTLNRPCALNALTLGMIEEITRALIAWKSDPSVEKVVFLACEGRAFCAGGDIADLYREGRAGNHDFSRRFWRTEYRLNALIAEYPKPTVSIVDGIVMGGGVGLAAHCSQRIMTENAVFAMPECSIGLINQETATETPKPSELRRSLLGSRDTSAANWLRRNGFTLGNVVEITRTGKVERWRREQDVHVYVVFYNGIVSEVLEASP